MLSRTRAELVQLQSALPRLNDNNDLDLCTARDLAWMMLLERGMSDCESESDSGECSVRMRRDAPVTVAPGSSKDTWDSLAAFDRVVEAIEALHATSDWLGRSHVGHTLSFVCTCLSCK